MNSKAEIKKPPDIESIDEIINEQVYRTIKCPLKTVLKNYHIIHPIIDNLIKDINQLIILGYQFIRLFLLDKFTKEQVKKLIEETKDLLKLLEKALNNL
jgi:hypothetical protein